MGWKDTIKAPSKAGSWKDTIKEAGAEEVSQGRAALLGAGSNAAFGFDDEIVGGVSALMSLLDPDNKSSMGDVYDGVRDITREENKAAQEQHPGTYLAGSLAGGMLTGAGLAKAGIGMGAKAAGAGANLARGEVAGAAAQSVGNKLAGFLNRPLSNLGKPALAMEGPAFKSASAMQNILNAGKVGLGSGAVTGLGMNESDLTTGEGLGNAALESAGTAVVGGGFGMGLSGLSAVAKGTGKAIGNFANENEFLGNIGEAFGREAKGDMVVGKSVRRGIERELADSSNEMIEKLEALKIRMGQAKGVELDKNKHLIIDFTKKLEANLEKARLLPEDTQQQLGDKNELIGYLSKKLNGYTKNIDVKTIESEGEKVLAAAQPSGAEKMNKIIASKLEKDRVLGVNSNINAVESPDGKMITAVRTVNDITPEEKLGVTLKRSFDNSPEDKVKAQAALAKLNSKARIEGLPTEYELIDDTKEGFYHVIAKDLPPQSTSGSSANVAAQVPNTPAVSAQMEYFPQTESIQNVPIQMPGTASGSFGAQDQFRQSTQQLSSVYNPSAIKSPNAQRVVQSIVRDLGDELVNAETGAPGLATANRNFSKAAKALERAGAEDQFGVKTDYDKTKVVGNILERAEQDTITGGKTRRLIDEIIGNVEDVDPKLADELMQTIGDKSSKFDLIRKINKEGMFNQVKAPIFNKANIIGIAGYAGRAVKSVKDLTAASPQSLKDIADSISSYGGPKFRSLADKLKQASEKDSVARNALIFALEQNFENRQLLREAFGWEDNKKK